MIKAIIFDFGRVISSQKPLQLFRTYEKDLGLAPGQINKIMFDSQEWQDALLGHLTVEDFWYAIGPRLGLRSRGKIDAFRHRYQADESINRGVHHIIRELHGLYRLAVLSNSPPSLDQWLLDWGLFELFDVVFCSGDEGLVKPNPAAYKTVLERLGILPHEAIFIDDTTGHVTAAQKLGIHGMVFTTAGQLNRDLNTLLVKENHPDTE